MVVVPILIVAKPKVDHLLKWIGYSVLDRTCFSICLLDLRDERADARDARKLHFYAGGNNV